MVCLILWDRLRLVCGDYLFVCFEIGLVVIVFVIDFLICFGVLFACCVSYFGFCCERCGSYFDGRFLLWVLLATRCVVI